MGETFRGPTPTPPSGGLGRGEGALPGEAALPPVWRRASRPITVRRGRFMGQCTGTTHSRQGRPTIAMASIELLETEQGPVGVAYDTITADSRDRSQVRRPRSSGGGDRGQGEGGIGHGEVR